MDNGLVNRAGVSSKAAAPDLDWSQVSETVRMLNLAVAQIAMAMHEGEDSVESLTKSFTDMVSNVEEISQVLRGDRPAEPCPTISGRRYWAIVLRCRAGFSKASSRSSSTIACRKESITSSSRLSH